MSTEVMEVKDVAGVLERIEVRFPTSEFAIQSLADGARQLNCDTDEGYKQTCDAVQLCVKLRNEIEKKRVELKADSLAWGRKVDAEAKRLKEKLLEIEEPLKAKRLVVDARIAQEKEAIAAKKREEEERKRKAEFEETQRLQAEYEERCRQERAKEEARLQAEREKLLEERRKMEEEQRLEREKIAEERRQLLEEQRKVREAEEEKARIERERLAAEERVKLMEEKRRLEKQFVETQIAARNREANDIRLINVFGYELRQWIGQNVPAQLDNAIPQDWIAEKVKALLSLADDIYEHDGNYGIPKEAEMEQHHG
jgi:hypothetical protein